MATRRSLHVQLSSVLETMAKSALSRVCELVDEDLAELRLGFSQLLGANCALTEQVKSLECELTTVRSNCSCNGYRSVGVQTACHRDRGTHVSGSLSIEGIFGKDWCLALWKDRGPHDVEKHSPPPQASEESVATLSQIKEEMECVEEAAGSCQQETPSPEEPKESVAEEPEQPLLASLSVGGGGTCGPSFDQDGEQVVCAGGNEEPTSQLISISETEEAFSTYTFPIEEEEEEDDDDDDDDGAQFVEESQQKTTVNAKGGPSHRKRDTANNSENSTAPRSLDDSDTLDVETVRRPKKDEFPCQKCSLTFFNKGTRTRHMKCHKSNFCNICKRQFSQRCKFESHTCSHGVCAKRVDKSCRLCGKIFANPSALKIHSVVHTGEKPYRCSLCGKWFTQKGNLKCHLQTHTGETPFRCVKCGNMFSKKGTLDRHLKTHRNSKRP